MIDSGNFPAALLRDRRYQFPGSFNETYQSTAGVVTFGALYVNYGYGSSSDSIIVDKTTSQTITIYASGGGDPGYKVGWIVYLWAGLETSSTYMLARITAYDATDPYNVQMTFQAYQAQGTGTFNYWTIRPQFQNAVNYIQNPNYTGFNVSARYYADAGRASFVWPHSAVVTNVVTSNTNTYKSGYTLQEYSGQVEVYEDEYEINRPYVGKTATIGRVLTTDVTTTTWDYLTDPPTEMTTTTSSTETVSHSHSFVNADFDPSDSHYVPGGAAVYADGNLVTPPSPGHMTTETAKLGEYKSYEYANSFQEYPAGSGHYRPTYSVITVRTFGDATYSPISPPDFFNGI